MEGGESHLKVLQRVMMDEALKESIVVASMERERKGNLR